MRKSARPRRLPRLEVIDIVGLIICAVGAVLLVVSWIGEANYRSHRWKQEVTATLVDVDEDYSRVWDREDEEWDDRYDYTLTYRYVVDGEPHTFQKTSTESFRQSSFDGELTLHAYADEDGTWHVTEFASHRTVGLFVIAVGAIVLVVGRVRCLLGR